MRLEIRTPSFVHLADGRKIAYDELKPTTTTTSRGIIFFIPGLGGNRLLWYNQLPFFAAHGYHAIAIDNRDVGDSSTCEAQPHYTLADLVADAAAVLKSIILENQQQQQQQHKQATVVGLSMGGMIAQELALHHPELVERLVLLSTTAGGREGFFPGPNTSSQKEGPSSNKSIVELARDRLKATTGPGFVESHPDRVEEYLHITAVYKPTSPDAYNRQFNAVQAHDTGARLCQLKMPVLVIHGDSDTLLPLANGRYIADKLGVVTSTIAADGSSAGSSNVNGRHKFLVYPNGGHLLMLEQPFRFNLDVLAFLHSNNNNNNSDNQSTF